MLRERERERECKTLLNRAIENIVSFWGVSHMANFDSPYGTGLKFTTLMVFFPLYQDTPLEIHRKIEDVQERNTSIHIMKFNHNVHL